MKVLITGGHLTPALAVIEEMPKSWEVHFVGRKFAMEGENSESLEYKTISRMGIKFYDLNAGRIQRTFTKHTVSSVGRIPKSYLKSYRLLSSIKPDVVVGFGGYVSVPVVIVAKFLGIPSMIHEQTIEPGASNKILSRFADRICVSWQNTLKYFPKDKTVLVGNPVRRNTFVKFNLPKGDKPLLFITGGSTGSHAINVLIEEALDDLLKKYKIIHQTGESHFNDYERLSKKEDEAYLPLKNIEPESMGFVFENSSLVISRSGINTVTELIRFNKPAILIPLVSGQKNEQERNASFLKNLGLAEIINQSSATSEMLMLTVNEMFKNIGKYANKESQILAEDSAGKLVELIKDVADKKTKTSI